MLLSPSTIMFILWPKRLFCRWSVSDMSKRILGTEMKTLAFMLTLPLAEVVDMSAENGCGIWARAKTLHNTRTQAAKATESLCFMVVFSPETQVLRPSYTPNSAIRNGALQNPPYDAAFVSRFACHLCCHNGFYLA